MFNKKSNPSPSLPVKPSLFKRLLNKLMILVLLSGAAALTFFLLTSRFSPIFILGPDIYQAPHVTKDMMTPEFWINQIPNPQKSLKPIQEENLSYLDQSELTQAEIIQVLNKDMASLLGRKLYDRNLHEVNVSDENHLKAMQFQNLIPSITKVQFGVLTRDTPLRILPTYEPLTQKPGDLEFDELENSRARSFRVAKIIHTTQEEDWYYVVLSDQIRGWVSINDIALIPNADTALHFLESKNFLIVLEDQITVYADSNLTTPFSRIRMGTPIPLASEATEQIDPLFYEVLIPIKTEGGKAEWIPGYVKRTDGLHQGYLPLTGENIIRQAFRLLGEPYGWGGQWSARDCSSYLQDIFSTMGLNLPRNSKDQALVGLVRARFDGDTLAHEKLDALDETPPAMSLLRLNGHIMLYLGKAKDRHFVIHNTFGFRKKWLFKDQLIKVNQVIVSDLSLGEDSKGKSLFERLIAINTIAD